MKKLFSTLFLSSQLLTADPLPLANLDHKTVDHFLPQVVQELETDLSRQNDERTNRSVKEYGYSFFRMEQGDFSYTDQPEFLNELGDLVCDSLGHPRKKIHKFYHLTL